MSRVLAAGVTGGGTTGDGTMAKMVVALLCEIDAENEADFADKLSHFRESTLASSEYGVMLYRPSNGELPNLMSVAPDGLAVPVSVWRDHKPEA